MITCALLTGLWFSKGIRIKTHSTFSVTIIHLIRIQLCSRIRKLICYEDFPNHLICTEDLPSLLICTEDSPISNDMSSNSER